MSLAARSLEPQGAQPATDLASIIELCAVDGELFGRTFFPRTFRQSSAPMHHEIWRELLSPHRYSAICAFRGSSKTTLTRVFTLFRIAYGLSHTILFVSSSQAHAVRSVEWVKKQIEFNKALTSTFKLSKGSKWTGEEIEIVHGVEDFTVRLIAVGLTGQLRGVNVDDYRPDLIVTDDPLDEESVLTVEQREKTEKLFFGALAKSLAPRTESPEAKMVLLQTPLHREDLISRALCDPQWHALTFGCFDENGQSRWPDRFPTEELRAEREAHIQRNQLSLWLREMECKLIDPESAAFKSTWLQYWDVLPSPLRTYMAIDPAVSGSKAADYQAVVIIGLHDGKLFLCEYSQARGQDPEDLAAEFFRLAVKWRPLNCAVEAVAYQKTLAWFLRREMQKRGIYVPIVEYRDRRSKYQRIVQSLAGRAANGAFYVHKSHDDFITQFCDYPEVSHDDLLDATAMATSLINPMDELCDDELMAYADAEKVVRLGDWRRAP